MSPIFSSFPPLRGWPPGVFRLASHARNIAYRPQAVKQTTAGAAIPNVVSRSAWGPLKAGYHEVKQVFPTLEEQVACQCPDVVEERLAGAQCGSHTLVLAVRPLEHGVTEKGEQDEAKQHTG